MIAQAVDIVIIPASVVASLAALVTAARYYRRGKRLPLTHVAPYTDAQSLFEMMLRGSEDWLGVVLQWPQ